MTWEENGALTWSEVQLKEPPQYMTTTVALITSGGANDYNVMAAEWTYLVARRPPYLMVCVQDGNVSGDLIAEQLEFGATFLTDEQSVLADVAGHFSKSDITKLSALVFETVPGQKIGPPVIRGGLATFECCVERLIRLPGYRLFIARVLAAQTDPAAHAHPLVKHGGMYRMGAPINDSPLALAADFVQTDQGDYMLRIAGRIPHRSIGATRGVNVWIEDQCGQSEGPYWAEVDDRGYFYEMFAATPVFSPIPFDIGVTNGHGISSPVWRAFLVP